ncbi:hypothetical protein [Pseudomonas sp. Fl4BN1]|uniref:hypothetical protein n=1 Tax=Pseudomonas sp. Fl4BN1 TaxID=2697651 RepID=UPI0015B3B3E1|nr:hypothetical protein [Pseudomonas sp. Fl4BN1]
MSVDRTTDYFESSEGAVRLWIEQGSAIHLKAISPHNDPVELTAEQALQRLASRLAD